MLQVDVVTLRIPPASGKRWVGPEIFAKEGSTGVIQEDEKRIL